jgi:hypothetical protein
MRGLNKQHPTKVLNTLLGPLDLSGAMSTHLAVKQPPLEFNNWINYIRAEVKKKPIGSS